MPNYSLDETSDSELNALMMEISQLQEMPQEIKVIVDLHLQKIRDPSWKNPWRKTRRWQRMSNKKKLTKERTKTEKTPQKMKKDRGRKDKGWNCWTGP